jgi:predicted Fe-Mo cluster-binding NifX family protein
MKLAVTAAEGRLDAPVDARFGRAPWFIVAETETGEWEAVANDRNLNAAQGAGVQSAQCVAERDVEAVLTGHCGPKAFRALAAAGIRVFTGVDGRVNEAIERWKNGDVTESSAADVDGHWT